MLNMGSSKMQIRRMHFYLPMTSEPTKARASDYQDLRPLCWTRQHPMSKLILVSLWQITVMTSGLYNHLPTSHYHCKLIYTITLGDPNMKRLAAKHRKQNIGDKGVVWEYHLFVHITQPGKRADVKTWILVWRSCGRISGASLYINIIGQRSRSPGKGKGIQHLKMIGSQLWPLTLTLWANEAWPFSQFDTNFKKQFHTGTYNFSLHIGGPEK